MLKNILLLTGFFLTHFSFSQLSADFTANTTEICLGESIQFTDLSTEGGSPIVAWTWDFGDGNDSNDQNPSHTYASSGTYNITLTVQTQGGSSEFEVKPSYITVHDLPTVDFDLSSLTCQAPYEAEFTNNSSNGAQYTYDWDFDNGQTSTAYTPIGITYDTPGTYTVSLTVVNTNTGCENSMNIDIEVNEYNAAIDAPSSICLNEIAQINDASTAGTNNWNWNFGDGQTSSNQNNNVSYSSPGIYTITLNASNTTLGCSDVATQDIEVFPIPSPSFDVDPTIGCAPLDVDFTNTSAGSGSYEWDFGDGTTFSGENPGTQTYAANGTYDVSLTMTDANGCSTTITQNNAVTVESVVPDFEADVVEGCEPLEVNFTDLSTSPNPTDDPIVSWEWDFGNGNTFSGQTPPTETYDVGVYSVTLTVTTANGCTQDTTFIDTIQVGSIDLVDFTVDPTIECAKQSIDFTNGTVISAPHDPTEVEYDWDFGDGGSSTQENPSYPYPSDTGYFDVTLIVNFRGCEDTLTIDSAVYIMAPISLFQPDPTLFCNPTSLPITVNVADQAIIGDLPSDDVEMFWDWGDGNIDYFDDAYLDANGDGSTTHDYSAYGTYVIEQAVYNYTTGCEDSTEVTVFVSETEASFALSNDSVCVNSSFSLTDESTSSHPFGTYEYDMGNGDVLTDPNTSYTYNTPGIYNIVLTATNSVGCFDDTTITIEVLALPVASASPSQTAGCADFFVEYTNTSTNPSGVPLESFDWTFPDASTQVTTSIGETVDYTFTTEGNFVTTLVVTDEFGCVSTPTQLNVEITKPDADFSVDPVVCNTAPFVATNNTTGAGPITYEWNLDGTLDETTQNYNGQFNESEATTSATHDLQLIATDVNGCKDTLTETITVSNPIADFTYDFTAASIDSEGNFTCPPVFANFTDGSSSYGAITDYDWDFGNGNSSILQDPSNTYVFAGTYSISLVIQDEYGCIDDTLITDYLEILGPTAEPGWTFIGDACNPMYEFYAENQSSDITEIDWNLDDGTSVSSTDPFTHQYTANGTYNPTMLIEDAEGCSVLYELDPLVVSGNVITASFTIDPLNGSTDDDYLVTDNSTSTTSPITSWFWDMSVESFNLTNGNPFVYNWSEPGEHTVTLVVTDGLGCVDTAQIVVNVIEYPKVPNVLTANNDGTNDLFTLNADYFDENGYEIIILNRWGNVVSEKAHHTGLLLWDGKNQKTGKMCQEGVYFYKLTGTLIDGHVIDLHGNVTLVLD